MRHTCLRAALLAVSALGLPDMADAAGFNQFVGFGDSTMDSGYFRYNSTGSAAIDAAIKATVAAGGSGAFDGPGVVDTVLLAAKFGLSAAPYVVGGGGGTNYANGAAQTVATFSNNGQGLPANVPTTRQIANYLATVHGTANRDALYLIDTGHNDAGYVQTPGVTVSPSYLAIQAVTLTASVSALQAAGARTIVVDNIYDYARLVDATGSLSATNAAFVAQATVFSAEIWSDLAADGVNFIPGDIENLLKYVSRNPTKFGFTAATVLSTNPACATSSALLCAPSQLVSPNALETHLFADAKHLTTAGQTIEADYLYSLLAAPSQISLLAESAVQGGLARMATIQKQIDLSEDHRGPSGINAWVSSGANALRLKNSRDLPNASGTPFGGSVGADYRTPAGIIAGVAVTAGSQTQDFSTGGHFDQQDEALSLYGAYRHGPAWGNAIVSYGLLQNHLARQVTLGTYAEQNKADTDGRSPAVAFLAGYDLRLGPLISGPVAGVVLQQVRLDGLTESGPSGITALAFSSQRRDSTVSRLGWRGSVDIDDWRPFAAVDWNHEWANKNRTLTTSLTSIAAPAYSAATAPLAADWATASLGADYRLTSQVTLRAATSAVFANPHVSSYGGDLSLNVSF
ncbi:autotransporter domain-containing protein [Telmatospirillum sp.]|uniref:autotransporter outer membrane beta-barrel domain-containing protein n=1 Tax=Telmatospirillum sp. TaxID=2079197 RepID=UPI00283C70EC|nr:autotransporter domain-containing protein [Telmatospirillum sp.]MDR3439527.1 autotransporter domain-containing protein [Telmatospirillum sp.]